MNAKEFKNLILNRLAILLRDRNFRKSGNTFQASNGALNFYVNMQSSVSSTSTLLKFTLNLSILSKQIYQLQDTWLPEKHVRHFEKRVGSYLEGNGDKWWTVSTLTEAETAASEVVAILKDKVLPEFHSFRNENDLIDLWKNNQAPGLTDGQRKELLSLIDR